MRSLSQFLAKAVLFIKVHRNLSLSLAAVGLASLVAVGFQNCAGTHFGTEFTQSSNQGLGACTDPNCQNIINGVGDCLFNGQTVTNGSTVTAFLNSSGATCDSETRTCNNGVLSGSYQFAACTTTGGNQSCLFNGVTVPDGASVTAYLASSGLTCTSETRTCHNGTLSGSYAFGSCTVNTMAACLFNGVTVPSGYGAIAFQNSSVPAGSICSAEFRLCTNGILSGSFQFASCTIDQAPQMGCIFNGVTIPSGASTFAYQNSSVPNGQLCVQETRTCTNGTLSGSYNFSACSVGAPASCLFNGQTLPSGSSVQAYQNASVPSGSTCNAETRTCTDGVLSGSYTNATCTVDLPVACTFNGQTVASGSTVVAYQNSTVPFGQTCVQEIRSCDNGALSGTFNFATCTPGQPAGCQFNGQTIASGQTVTAFQNSTVPFGQTCAQETRTCTNGVLSGTYNYGSCAVDAPSACLFNGQTIASGASVQAYPVSAVPFGQSCAAETRTCTNGVLSGSSTFASCTVNGPASCSFNGMTIANGQTVTAYQSSSVSYNQTCKKETRTCQNGVLSGSYAYGACAQNEPRGCLFNGHTLCNGQHVTAYASSLVPAGQTCQSETRTCTNGQLSGNYTYSTCAVDGPQWVNVKSCGEAHAQTCARVGKNPVTSSAPGICASTESRPGPNSGTGWDKINYTTGIKNPHGEVYKQVQGGVEIVKKGSTYYCYKSGQKKDNDKTDQVMAYLCK